MDRIKSIIEKEIQMVIGANFGDEGKGLMTDYFCRKAASAGKSCLVICHNGGSQRGHTVTRNHGLRHVFHHFGSGSFAKAATYLSEDFICNPMVFRREWEELEEKGCQPQVWLHPHCRITTPFDMIFNQLFEEHRAQSRHGSCGLGIFETICRCRQMEEAKCPYHLNALLNAGEGGIQKIRDEYFLSRLEMMGIALDKEWREIIFQEGLIRYYLEDLHFMAEKIKFSDPSIFDDFSVLVFEGGQGLLLDQDNRDYFPHLTPSSTGRKNPTKLLGQWLGQRGIDGGGMEALPVEVCYVTRPYLTRHGAGRLEEECGKDELCPGMEDLTNVANPYQGKLRYGRMDVKGLKKRIAADFGGYPGWKCSIAITHGNEAKGYFISKDRWDVREFFQGIDRVYRSDKEGEDSVYVESPLP